MGKTLVWISALFFAPLAMAGEIAASTPAGEFFCDVVVTSRQRPLNVQDPRTLARALRESCNLGLPFSFAKNIEVAGGYSGGDLTYCCTHK